MSKWKDQIKNLEEFKKKLKNDFPNLYKYLNRDRSVPYCSLCIGKGWFDIIYNLSAKIEPELLKISKDNRPAAIQIKEKFGSLRYYMLRNKNGIPTNIETLVNAAEIESSKTCEQCGKPGTSKCNYIHFWIKTLCPECHKERSNANKS